MRIIGIYPLLCNLPHTTRPLVQPSHFALISGTRSRLTRTLIPEPRTPGQATHSHLLLALPPEPIPRNRLRTRIWVVPPHRPRRAPWLYTSCSGFQACGSEQASARTLKGITHNSGLQPSGSALDFNPSFPPRDYSYSHPQASGFWGRRGLQPAHS